jgi:outer membrane lipoprotein carrier protein
VSWRSRFLGIVCVLALSAAPVTGFAQTAPASGVDILHRFFRQVDRYTALFNQVVLDETGEKIQDSKGRLWIERPNKFRWNYETPYKQQIVSDGEKLWVYDEDLKQVTVRALKGGLLDTPAVLLAGKGKLEQQFDIQDGGGGNNLTWVVLTPKKKDTGFEKVRIGFEQTRLRTLELIDGLGQTTRYTLSGGLENQPIDPARFTFTPPPGVDIVGEQ